jgi:hypothetical protein
MGIDSPRVFWEEIVNPTWEEGSLTSVGYTRLIARRAAGHLLRTGRSAADQALEEAAGRFVSAYLAASVIDPRWHSLLRRLSASPRILVLIATDHYAEATGAILNHLAACRCRGIALRDLPAGEGGPKPGGVVIANSADLGAWKNAPSFWERIQAVLPLEAVRQAFLVEDFGAAEQEGDTYGATERIAGRRQRTLEVMGQVFPFPVTAIDVIPPPGRGRESWDALLAETARTVMVRASG